MDTATETTATLLALSGRAQIVAKDTLDVLQNAFGAVVAGAFTLSYGRNPRRVAHPVMPGRGGHAAMQSQVEWR